LLTLTGLETIISRCTFRDASRELRATSEAPTGCPFTQTIIKFRSRKKLQERRLKKRFERLSSGNQNCLRRCVSKNILERHIEGRFERLETFRAALAAASLIDAYVNWGTSKSSSKSASKGHFLENSIAYVDAPRNTISRCTLRDTSRGLRRSELRDNLRQAICIN